MDLCDCSLNSNLSIDFLQYEIYFTIKVIYYIIMKNDVYNKKFLIINYI